MPKLEHANIDLPAIEPTLKFLTIAFPEWRVRGEGRYQGARWLHFGDDETYLTLNDGGAPAGGAGPLSHLGFEVASLADVVARLEEAGYKPHHQGPDHPFRRNAYFFDAQGLEFEFVEYRSGDPKQRNLYA